MTIYKNKFSKNYNFLDISMKEIVAHLLKLHVCRLARCLKLLSKFLGTYLEVVTARLIRKNAIKASSNTKCITLVARYFHVRDLRSFNDTGACGDHMHAQ